LEAGLTDARLTRFLFFTALVLLHLVYVYEGL
jgi:hypothetical protein